MLKLGLHVVISMNAVPQPMMLFIKVKCVTCYLCVRIISFFIEWLFSPLASLVSYCKFNSSKVLPTTHGDKIEARPH